MRERERERACCHCECLQTEPHAALFHRLKEPALKSPERVLRSVSNVTALQMLHTETVESALEVTRAHTHTHTHTK